MGPPSPASVLLFDGIKGNDPLTNRVIASCEHHGVRLARFDIANRSPEERQQMYSELDEVLSAPHRLWIKVSVTVDGSLGNSAERYVHEVARLAKPGFWKRAAPQTGQGSSHKGTSKSEEDYRRLFQVMGDAVLQNMGSLDQARLSAGVIANLAVAASWVGRSGASSEAGTKKARKIAGAEVPVCLDVALNQNLQQWVSSHHGRYVAHALNHEMGLEFRSALPHFTLSSDIQGPEAPSVISSQKSFISEGG